MKNECMRLAVVCLATLGASLESAAKAADKLAPVNVGVLKMASLTNPWIAKKDGIFAKNGINAKLVEFTNGNEAISALQGGSLDIVLSIPGTAMTAIENGFKLVAIAQNEVAHKVGPDSGSLQVRVGSSIKTLSDLAGKKIAVSALHSQNTVGVQMLLKKAGVDLTKVQFIEIPYPNQLAALKSKQVDAVATVDPYTTQLQDSGIGRVLSWNYVASIPQQPLGAWYAKAAYVKKHPKRVEEFARSIKDSIEWMNANPKRARAAVVAYTGLDPALVKNMPMIDWDSKVQPKKWQEVIDMMVKSGDLQKPHKASEFLAYLEKHPAVQ